MVETLLASVVVISTALLGVYAVTGFMGGLLYNLSPKFRQYVNTLLSNFGEDGA